MKAVLVTWQDAVSVDAWEDISKAKETNLHTIHTLGFLIHEDEDRYLIAHNIDLDGDACSQHIAIPKTWIIEFKDILLLSNRSKDPKKMPEHRMVDPKARRNHKLRCLRCELPFLSKDIKTNRICHKCKSDESWKYLD